MRSWKALVPICLICSAAFASESRLPFSTVFKGQDHFNRLVAKAKAENWKALPIGERTAAVGQALAGDITVISRQTVHCWGHLHAWKPTFLRDRSTRSQKVRSKQLSQNCAAAMLLASFHASEMDFIRPLMSAWPCAQVTAFCTSCTPPLRAIMAAWSSTTNFQNICTATIRTAG